MDKETVLYKAFNERQTALEKKKESPDYAKILLLKINRIILNRRINQLINTL